MSSTPSTPDVTSKYDSMPQPALVAQCKKQILLLQKLKVKCDQVQKKLNDQSDYDQIKEECERAVRAEAELKKAKTSLEDKLRQGEKRVEEAGEEQTDTGDAQMEGEKETDHMKNEADSTLVRERDSLKIQVEELKEQISRSSSAAAEDASGKTELETMRKELEEKEVLIGKLKGVAMKMKKELNNTTKQLQQVSEEAQSNRNKIQELEKHLQGTRSTASTVQIMQKEHDDLHDKLDLAKEEKQQVHKMLDDTTQQLQVKLAQNEELTNQLEDARNLMRSGEAERKELEAKVTSLTTTVTSLEMEKEASSIEKSTLKQEVERLGVELEEARGKVEAGEQMLREKENQLKQSQKEAHKGELMSMELSECESTVATLTDQLQQARSDLQQLQAEVDDMKAKMEQADVDRRSIVERAEEEEERARKSEANLLQVEKIRDDLLRVEGELRKENEQLARQVNDVNNSYNEKQAELNCRAREHEASLALIAQLRAEATRVDEEHQRQTAQLQESMDEVREGSEKLRMEYEGYKVRVHSVLKQQKVKHDDRSQPTQAQVSNLRAQVEQLEARLVQSQRLVSSRDVELELLQKDYDMVLHQQLQSSDSAVEREKRWKNRVKSLQAEVTSMRREHAEAVERVGRERDEAVGSRDRKVRELEGRVEEAEEERARMEERMEAMRAQLHQITISNNTSSSAPDAQAAPTRKTSTMLMMTSTPRRASRDHDESNVMTMMMMQQREQGEGEERKADVADDVDTASCSQLSFERLIEGPKIQSVKMLSDSESVTSEVAMKQLETKLDTMRCKLAHLNEVAHDSELAQARLNDQNKVLKDEIRRLERNQAREGSMANLEYLKNVIVKFILLPPCDERRHLLPVIDTMLRLTAEEKNKLVVVAQGESSLEQDSGGWGGYFQRWSGV